MFRGAHSCTLCGLRRPSKALTGIWLDAVHVSPPTAGGLEDGSDAEQAGGRREERREGGGR